MEGGYNLRNPAVKRLMREAQELKDKTEQFSAYPLEDNLFEWHFTIRGPADSEFENGLYHGRIVLPPEYPMKPPSIILLTPSGRFETNRKICLSISGFHPESWQPSWSLRTALLGIIGFMPTHGNGAIGSLDYTPEERKLLARKSQDWKCPHCGLIKDLVLPITELSKELAKEAKEIGQQINMQGEKTKTLPEMTGTSEPETSNTGDVAGNNATPVTSTPSEAASPTASTSVPQAPMPTTLPLFMAFQRLQAPGVTQNTPFPYPYPPMPIFAPPFPLQFPGIPLPTTSQTQQLPTNQAVNPPFPFIPPPFFLPNLMFNPNSHFVLPNFSSVPTPFNSSTPSISEVLTWPVRVTSSGQQANPSHASTVTVSSQTTLISSPVPMPNASTKPKEPSSPSTATASSSNVATSDDKPSSSSSPQQPTPDEKSQPIPMSSTTTTSKSEVVRSEDSSVGSVEETQTAENIRSTSGTAPSLPVSSSRAPSDRTDDGDPVPLASNLHRRVKTSTNAGQTNQPRVNRTNMPAEPSDTDRPRYTTRAGIVEAMADILVIILLFCIFGLLARRVSMLL